MVLRIKPPLNIENLRNHPAEAVERLRRLLTSGAPARREAYRPGFFEVEDGDRVFYIHISPVSGKVLLLATWVREPGPKAPLTAEQVA
jgi:hypothetical protein